jgi:carbonic anhydrase/acetyltransferase-like protein (isoleucine patch superfamily)
MTDFEKRLGRFLLKRPVLGKSVYIARGAIVLGSVTLGDHASIWYNAVLRGDINRIVVGRHTNIQDTAVVHLADELACVIGNYVTVGHGAIVHACTVRDGSLVGMGATILDGAEVGEQSLVGARALVPQGMKVPPGSLVLGAPGRVVRKLTKAERAQLKRIAIKYSRYGAYCLARGINVSGPLVG